MSRRPRTSWIEVMPKAAAMVEAAVGRGEVVTARRLFYMLVAARLIPNDETAYKGVLRETAVRRRRREFPRLDDPGREVNGGGGWSGPEAFVDDLLQQTKGYQRNRTDGQREQTWIVTEKATVDLLARRWYADRSLYVVGLRGYWSVALVEDVAKLMALDGRPAFAPGEPSRERFAEWLETWWRREAATWAASTRMERGYRIDRWIEPYLGQVRLADLGPGRVRDWRAAILADGASAHTANAAKSILSSILGAAVSDGRLPANPVLGIRDLPHAVSRPTALTPLQIERIRAAMPSDRDVVMVGLMAYAGLRPGEVAALTWGSIGRRLTVDRAYSHGELKGTKTHQRRSVAIPPPLADDLARHREQVEGDPAHLVAPALGRPGWRSRNPDRPPPTFTPATGATAAGPRLARRPACAPRPTTCATPTPRCSSTRARASAR